MSSEHIRFFFAMREQIKLYHWQTNSFSRHKATDEIIGKLDKSIDKFVEVYMGKYGRPRLGPKTNTFKLSNMSGPVAQKFVKGSIKAIQHIRSGLNDPADSDLINILDEMQADLNQLLYLFTLGK